MARDADIGRKHRLAPLKRDLDDTPSVLDLRTFEGLEQRFADLETELVGPVFKASVGNRISFSYLHLYAFSAQSY